MVHVRAAEGRHEEVVAQRVLLGDLPQVQVFRRFAVVAHHQAAAVGPRGKAVVLAAVDLHLVVIEAVHQVARDDAFGQGLAGRVAQFVGSVRQAGNLVFLDQVIDAADILLVRHQAAPDLRQGGQRLAVAVQLPRLFRRDGGQGRAGAGEVGKQVVEAAVFQIDHHHVLDVGLEFRVERTLGDGLPGWRGVGQRRQAGGQADCGSGLENAPARGIGGLVGRIGWQGGGEVLHTFSLGVSVARAVFVPVKRKIVSPAPG